MQIPIEAAIRQFSASDHIRNLLAGEWLELLDDQGKRLPGIRGRAGVAAFTQEGFEIGADLIEMQPGSAFPHHIHSGEHILYVIVGHGLVHVDGTDHPIQAGDTIFIPAEYPHNVRSPQAAGPLILLTVGYPHKGLAAHDRMRSLGRGAAA
jgi:quercetin dioxygenase-like cupin family protein